MKERLELRKLCQGNNKTSKETLCSEPQPVELSYLPTQHPHYEQTIFTEQLEILFTAIEFICLIELEFAILG